jgi:hypothetical protein
VDEEYGENIIGSGVIEFVRGVEMVGKERI